MRKDSGRNRMKYRPLAIALLQEIERDAIMFKSFSGEVFTAQDLIDGLSSGEDFAREYMADLFRVSRDLLAKRANSNT